jgi:Stealth protein CR2, conserved region 2/Stealth protein CR1, conserved region 1
MMMMKKPTNRPARNMVQSVPRSTVSKVTSPQTPFTHVTNPPSGKNPLDVDLGVIQNYKGHNNNYSSGMGTAPKLRPQTSNDAPPLTAKQQKFQNSLTSSKGYFRGNKGVNNNLNKSNYSNTPNNPNNPNTPNTNFKSMEQILEENADTSAVSFPIDMVYTWVDGSDEQWLKLRYKYQPSQRNIPSDSLQTCRWRDFDELRLSVESVYKFAPWIRNIFIVTDYQRPHWYNEDNPGKVIFIDHPEIFGDLTEEHLPTFNSHAIECHLHRIPGLSNQFIYANDDTFLGNYVYPLDFFTADGKFKVFLTINDMETEQSLRELQPPKLKTPHPQSTQKGGKMSGYQAAMNRTQSSSISNTSSSAILQTNILPYFTAQVVVNNILNQEFSAPIAPRKRLLHQMKAMTIEMYEWCWDNPTFQLYLFNTSSTRFRSLNDVDPTSLVSHTALLIGGAVPAGISSKYYGMQESDKLPKMFEYMYKKQPSPKLYCINDNLTNVTPELCRSIRSYLEQYLPHKFM